MQLDGTKSRVLRIEDCGRPPTNAVRASGSGIVLVFCLSGMRLAAHHLITCVRPGTPGHLVWQSFQVCQTKGLSL